jgi:Rieske Fe-S protein
MDPSRRIVLKSAALAGTAGLVSGIPVVAYVVAPGIRKAPGTWVNFGAVADLGPGKVKMLSYKLIAKDGWVVLPRRGVLWARTEGDGALKVFSSICPHLGCIVSWREPTGTFDCPCHSASFNASGEPISGPPRRPLAVLESKVEDGNLHVFLPV